jgi:hypothetical protein
VDPQGQAGPAQDGELLASGRFQGRPLLRIVTYPPRYVDVAGKTIPVETLMEEVVGGKKTGKKTVLSIAQNPTPKVAGKVEYLIAVGFVDERGRYSDKLPDSTLHQSLHREGRQAMIHPSFLRRGCLSFAVFFLLFAPLVAQSAEDDDIFGAEEVVSGAAEGTAQMMRDSFFTSSGVSLLGNFTGTAGIAWSWSDPWSGDPILGHQDSSIVDPVSSLALGFSAKPERNLSFYGEVRTAWPFVTEKAVMVEVPVVDPGTGLPTGETVTGAAPSRSRTSGSSSSIPSSTGPTGSSSPSASSPWPGARACSSPRPTTSSPWAR